MIASHSKNQHMITKFSSQTSNYAQYRIRLGRSGRAEVWLLTVTAGMFLPLSEVWLQRHLEWQLHWGFPSHHHHRSTVRRGSQWPQCSPHGAPTCAARVEWCTCYSLSPGGDICSTHTTVLTQTYRNVHSNTGMVMGGKRTTQAYKKGMKPTAGSRPYIVRVQTTKHLSLNLKAFFHKCKWGTNLTIFVILWSAEIYILKEYF